MMIFKACSRTPIRPNLGHKIIYIFQTLLFLLNFYSVCIPDELAKLRRAGSSKRMPNFETLQIFYVWYINRDRLTLPTLLSNAEFSEILNNPRTKLLTPADILTQKNYMRFLRLRGQATYELTNGVIEIGSFANGGNHELCKAVPFLSPNSPKTVVNAMSCDYCLMKFCENSPDTHLLELGINRKIQTIINLKKQAAKTQKDGTYQINKLMNSVLIEIRKIDQQLAVNITEIPSYRLVDLSRAISLKNNFSKGTRAALIKNGKIWGGLNSILSQFANETVVKFEVSNRSLMGHLGRDDSFGSEGHGSQSQAQTKHGFSTDTALALNKSQIDPLNQNVFALNDFSLDESWPSLPSGNPSKDEKVGYINKRRSMTHELLQLKSSAEEKLSSDAPDSHKIPAMLMLGEANRAITQEKRNHEFQKNKLRRFDVDVVNRAVKIVGTTTLVDELSKPDSHSYPIKNNEPAAHSGLSKAIVDLLFSKLSTYEKTKNEMQAVLDRQIEEIDGICSQLSNVVDPDLIEGTSSLKRIYGKMRDLCYAAGVDFADGEDFDSHAFDLGDYPDPTWNPEMTEQTENLICSFDKDQWSDTSKSSEESFIFGAPPTKKVKKQS